MFGMYLSLHLKSQAFLIEMNTCKKSKKKSNLVILFHIYRVFVRALFTVQGLDETKQASTTSNEVTTEEVIPLIDRIPRPVFKITRIGLQMVIFSSIDINLTMISFRPICHGNLTILLINR